MKQDAARERRIEMEIIVDAHTPEECHGPGKTGP
jgi:hypothetical protein